MEKVLGTESLSSQVACAMVNYGRKGCVLRDSRAKRVEQPIGIIPTSHRDLYRL